MSEEEEYRARENDHLVEPFFGGLGHAAANEEQESTPVNSSRLARILRFLRSLFSRG